MAIDILSAFALVFIIEGIIPFISPDRVRKMFLLGSQMNNKTLRFIGISSMLFGVLLLTLVR